MAVEPFGFEVENWRAGMIAAAICNQIQRTMPLQPGRPRPKPLTPSDFYPPIPGTRRRQLTPEQQAFIERRRRDRSRDRNS